MTKEESKLLAEVRDETAGAADDGETSASD
jgi:hypothetical protein